MNPAIRIIGIDPGLRRTGWGVIEVQGNTLRFVAAGTVKSDDKRPLAQRLCQLHDGLVAVLAAHSPQESAVEATFVSKDATATLKLGQARGIAMLVPALAGLGRCRICPQRREEECDRRRSWRQKAGANDGSGVAAEGSLFLTSIPPMRSPLRFAMRITGRVSQRGSLLSWGKPSSFLTRSSSKNISYL